MIYTVTLNPSIDYILFMESLKAGVTNRTQGEEYYIGGKGINVSCVLAELGVKSTALGFVAGFTGDAIEKGLKNSKITTDFVSLKDGISRINIKIKAEQETELNCQGPPVDEASLLALYDKIDNVRDGDTLVLAGSVPKTLPDDIYEKILHRLSDKDVKFVVDATKNLLTNSLKFKPFLIKPNLQELCELFEAEIKTEQEVLQYAKELQKMGAKNVLVSLGKDGALLLDENEKVYKTATVEGKPINTVGSGDSMVAGFIAGYLNTQNYAYALRLGTACGNATALSKGLATAEKIDEMLSLMQ